MTTHRSIPGLIKAMVCPGFDVGSRRSSRRAAAAEAAQLEKKAGEAAAEERRAERAALRASEDRSGGGAASGRSMPGRAAAADPVPLPAHKATSLKPWATKGSVSPGSWA